ncbi:MAG: ABC transporter permease [Candidatus Acidiferrum sp.]
MRRLRAWLIRLGGLFNKEPRERELFDEMDSHLQLHIEDNMRSGMSPAQARREAIMKLGGVEQTKENYRERRGLPLLEVFLQDLRFGARILRKNPGFTLVAVLTLALGIASNATIFSFVSAVLYKRPPVYDPDRVLVVYGTSSAQAWGARLSPVSSPNYFTWKRENKVFADLAASEPYVSVNLTGKGEPERISANRATANYFSVIGVAPELGRVFATGDDQPGHDRVVLLDYRFWEQKFGSDPNIIGKTIRLNGEEHTIIGVLPQRFQIISFRSQVWLPLVLDESQQSAAVRQTRTLYPFARLKPGVTLDQAQANIRTLGSLAAQSFPDTENGWSADCVTLQEYGIRDFNAGAAFGILLSAVGFVLLIACANIAGLLLARATSRGKEMAVRIAIGAGKTRVVRQLMTEALLIAVLGAIAGLGLALGGTQLLHKVLSFNEAIRTLDMRIDWPVLSFTSAIAVLSALLFGLAPALRVWAVEVFPTLKNDSTTVSAGKKKSRGRGVLVAAEVAMAVILLTGAGLLIKGFLEELHRSLGFQPEHLLTAQITLPKSRYKEQTKQIEFYRELTAHLESTPGAASAAITSSLPAAGAGFVSFLLEGQESLSPSDRARARYYVVGPGYFKTIQTPMIAGRDFTETDGANSQPVAVVTEKFVERFFPKGDALGKQLRIDSGDAVANQWRQIVGIVHDVKSWPLNFTDDPEIYEPFPQHPAAEMSVVVRAAGDPNSLAPGMREAVWSLDRDQPVGSVLSMPDLLANETAPDFIFSKLMVIFAALALVLAGIGIYGLVAFTVGQRSREIGIRVALGAEKKSILRMVLFDGLKLAAIGAAVGMIGAFLLPRLFEAALYDFHVLGGWLFLVVPALICAVALLACYIPARRAARVDPMVALRYE